MPVYEAFRGTRLLGRLFYAMHGEEGAPNDADVIDFFDRFDVRGRMEIERLWAEKGEIEATFDLRTEQADPSNRCPFAEAPTRSGSATSL